jgi:hypothetical protein
MQDTANYALTLQRKLITEFKQKFYEKLGYYPEVITHTTEVVPTGTSKIMRIPLDELKEIFDTRLLRPLVATIHGAQWITTISNRSRIRDICELRYMYYKIASLMGYSWCAIGRSLRMDHSSVMHGVQTLNGHLETDPGVRQDYYNTLLQIKQIIDNEYRHLECAGQVQDESQPVIPDSLHL